MLKRLWILAVTALLLASCSKKVAEAVTTDGVTDVQLQTVVKKVNANRVSLFQVSGRLSLDLAMGSQSVKVSGDLKMKRNSIIQITLQALGGLITVGRLEFTPDNMLVMDNMNKRYVRLPYKEVPFLQENGIDFYSFQSLLWNELFLPGSKDAVPQASAFSQSAEGEDVVLTHKAANLLLSFLTSPGSGRLQQSRVRGVQANRGMECQYQAWGNVKNESFPSKMQVNVDLGTQRVSATMDITKLRTDDSWKGTPTNIDPKKFQQLTLQQVWSAVMSLAK